MTTAQNQKKGLAPAEPNGNPVTGNHLWRERLITLLILAAMSAFTVWMVRSIALGLSAW